MVSVSKIPKHPKFCVAGEIVATWGRGEDGQLGHGDASEYMSPKAVHALLDAGISLVICGAEYTVAVSQQHRQIYSWGWCEASAAAVKAASRTKCSVACCTRARAFLLLLQSEVKHCCNWLAAASAEPAPPAHNVCSPSCNASFRVSPAARHPAAPYLSCVFCDTGETSGGLAMATAATFSCPAPLPPSRAGPWPWWPAATRTRWWPRTTARCLASAATPTASWAPVAMKMHWRRS